MNQELIGKTIKEIRQKENLSQQKFAKKYGVTYQAVSKWENGKNLPDITILKQICEDYQMNLEDFLSNKEKIVGKKQKKFFIYGLVILFLFLVIFAVVLLITYQEKDFEFKVLSSTSNNFNLYGSIAYNANKSSIHISNITYCGKQEDIIYESIVCSLYEMEGKVKKEIGKCNVEVEEPTSLEDFLRQIDFKVDNYDKLNKVYRENSLYLEIDAKNQDGQMMIYKIPLGLDDKCLNN